MKVITNVSNLFNILTINFEYFTILSYYISDNNLSSNPIMQLKASKSQPPLGALITIEAVKEKLPVDIKWDKETSIDIGDGVVLTTNTSIAR